MADTLILYSQLARWWPLLSPPDRYVWIANRVSDVIRRCKQIRGRTVLALGAGGGCLVHHLSRTYRVTVTDISLEMLAVSARMNPECEHGLGDMRALRLGRQFAAVIAEDAISYMATRADLLAALSTAYEHTAPGGVGVFVPEYTAETFAENEYSGSAAWGDERVRFHRCTRRLQDTGENYASRFVYLVTKAGAVWSAEETHIFGLFNRDVWLQLLMEVGFTSEHVILQDGRSQHRTQDAFVGVRRR